MKCTKCGTEIPEGSLYCQNCGQEIHLVPDYNPLDAIWQKQFTDGHSVTNKKKRRRFRAALILLFCTICVLTLVFVSLYLKQKHDNSYDYQFEHAEIFYSQKEYEKALPLARRALALQPKSENAAMLLAEIQTGLKDEKSAAETLLSIIREHPKSAAAYGQLLSLYEKAGEKDAIKTLMTNCESEEILTKYKAYISRAPISDEASQTFTDITSIQLYADEDCTIYYTLDKTDPTTESRVYSSSIELKEGDTVLRAIAVNAKGIESDISEYDYTVVLAPPEAPVITPKSGTFTEESKIAMIVPLDCVAYYAFDKDPTTEKQRYQGDVLDMPEGTHTLYAVCVNKYGKISDIVSETYTLTK